MADTESPVNREKIKKALCWLSETLLAQPDRQRAAALKEAELRFDLSPAECAFLDKNFGGDTPAAPC